MRIRKYTKNNIKKRKTNKKRKPKKKTHKRKLKGGLADVDGQADVEISKFKLNTFQRAMGRARYNVREAAKFAGKVGKVAYYGPQALYEKYKYSDDIAPNEYTSKFVERMGQKYNLSKVEWLGPNKTKYTLVPIDPPELTDLELIQVVKKIAGIFDRINLREFNDRSRKSESGREYLYGDEIPGLSKLSYEEKKQIIDIYIMFNSSSLRGFIDQNEYYSTGMYQLSQRWLKCAKSVDESKDVDDYTKCDYIKNILNENGFSEKATPIRPSFLLQYFLNDIVKGVSLWYKIKEFKNAYRRADNLSLSAAHQDADDPIIIFKKKAEEEPDAFMLDLIEKLKQFQIDFNNLELSRNMQTTGMSDEQKKENINKIISKGGKESGKYMSDTVFNYFIDQLKDTHYKKDLPLPELPGEGDMNYYQKRYEARVKKEEEERMRKEEEALSGEDAPLEKDATL